MTSVSEEVKSRVPWFVKIPAKIVLSRLPLEYRRWRYLNVFRAGAMDEPSEAFAIFKKHFDASGLGTLRDRNALELGPGDSLLTAIYAKSFGAAQTLLVDAVALASDDVSVFARAEQMLHDIGLETPEVGSLPSLDVVMKRLDAVYLTQGLASLQSVPEKEVDFLFSNAVLEHVRLSEFSQHVREMRRVLKPTGIASHQIDFRDHLQEGLNNLRFPQKIWESEFMASSGFYTNRLSWPAMKRIFEESGFEVQVKNLDHWPHGLPTSQSSMTVPFRDMPAEELMVKGAHVLLRPLS